ncbi:hypothetical protein L3Q82_018797 [Scortum barcoo]|uniref:Uncharacterized protein n=1 Tax=Scortum barcoo TaxID=214431 RepID=A0ACB8VI91_9TELE|nr:hypothetical protein L3Q82_018797 [Scortum barcoo]
MMLVLMLYFIVINLSYIQLLPTEDAIAFTLHTALSHLDQRDTYVRMLFIDYSSACSTPSCPALQARHQAQRPQAQLPDRQTPGCADRHPPP